MPIPLSLLGFSPKAIVRQPTQQRCFFRVATTAPCCSPSLHTDTVVIQPLDHRGGDLDLGSRPTDRCVGLLVTSRIKAFFATAIVAHKFCPTKHGHAASAGGLQKDPWGIHVGYPCPLACTGAIMRTSTIMLVALLSYATLAAAVSLVDQGARRILLLEAHT